MVWYGMAWYVWYKYVPYHHTTSAMVQYGTISASVITTFTSLFLVLSRLLVIADGGAEALVKESDLGRICAYLCYGTPGRHFYLCCVWRVGLYFLRAIDPRR